MGLPIENAISQLLQQIDPQFKDLENKDLEKDKGRSVVGGVSGNPHEDASLLRKEKVVSMLNGRIDEKVMQHLTNRLNSSPALRKIAKNLQEGQPLSQKDQEKARSLVEDLLGEDPNMVVI